MENRVRRSAFIAVSTVLLASSASAVPPGFSQTAQQILEQSYPADGPGAAVIVTEGGKTVYASGRGLADIKAGKPITPDTVFRLGSITKQFSAAVVMQLVDEGKLSLDDPLSKFLPDYPQGGSITVRQLLNHTSGVQSYTNIPGWMNEASISRPLTTAQLVAEFKDKPAPSKPGEQWEYNNSGYVLVGAIIEKVTGKLWHEAIEERIARPLKLSSIRFGENPPQAMAVGYYGGDSKAEPAMRIHMNVPHAAGGLIGSVGDLAAWGNALHNGKVVSAASYSAMTTPAKTSDGKDHPYGFGLAMDEVRGSKTIAHGGGIPGFSTNSVYVPEKKLFVAVFTNANDPAASPGITAQRLAAAALGQPYRQFKAVKADMKQLAPILGVYKIEGDGPERQFFERDGQLFTQRTGASESKVYAAGKNQFFYGPDSLNWFEIKTGASGVPTMHMHQGGADEAEIATRTGAVPLEAAAFPVPAATLKSYTGKFAAGAMVATVEGDPTGSLKLKLGGQDFVPLRAASATEFKPRGIDARVVFKPDGSGVTIHHGGKTFELVRQTAG